MSTTTAPSEPAHGGTRGGARGKSRGGAGPPVPVVQRPGHGNENGGTPIQVITNHFKFGMTLNEGIIYHYDVILPEGKSSASENFEIINALQNQVDPELFSRPGVYDGRRNLFTAFKLPFEGAREFVVPMGPIEYRVCLTHVASINAELLQRLIQGVETHDNSVLTAITVLNVALRMDPKMRWPYSMRSFFTDTETKDIGRGIVLWRGYFQSVRPAIGRMLINVDISTAATYKPGPLMDLALAFLDKSGTPNALAPNHGLSEWERIRLQGFIMGIKITTSHAQLDQDHQTPRRRFVRGLSSEGASSLVVEVSDGPRMTVANYFQGKLNRQLLYPDVICVELSTGGWIPLELCTVPPGQIMRRQVPLDRTNALLEFAKQRPNDRLTSIRNGYSVLQYGQSAHIQEFGMVIENEPLKIQGRVLDAPTLQYHPVSKQPTAKPRDGAWNLIDRHMFSPCTVPNWIVVIYEGQQRFDKAAADQMTSNLVKSCGAAGITINSQPTLTKWEQGQGHICQQLQAACNECRHHSGYLPTLIVVILPEDANSIYAAVKFFGDVTVGVATQCMKSQKCLSGSPHYYANVSLKLNVKLGGINAIIEPQDVSFLVDPENPTMVMATHVVHPTPGSAGRPSIASLVGSIDENAVRYVSTMEVQTSRKELIEAMESMCMNVLKQYKDATGKFPKRILFYHSGVSEGQFAAVLENEVPLIRSACQKLGIDPKITLVVVGKRHRVRFFPRSASDGGQSGNCPAGTVVDTDIVDPVRFDFFLLSHGGSLGTSRPTHYNVLVDDNNFTADDIQSLTYALCHINARATTTIAIPVPLYYAEIASARARCHFDPQLNLDNTEAGTLEAFRQGFQPTHERMKNHMYFC